MEFHESEKFFSALEIFENIKIPRLNFLNISNYSIFIYSDNSNELKIHPVHIFSV